MDRIERIDLLQVDLAPQVVRSDAIQSFVAQETPIVRITCADGAQGTGYSYTIGTGGSSVVALIRDPLAPRLIGRDSREIEGIWKALFFHTHATAVGAITSLALAAIDTALWDMRCRPPGPPPPIEGGRVLPPLRSSASYRGGRRTGLDSSLHDRGRLAAHRGGGAGRGRASRQGG